MKPLTIFIPKARRLNTARAIVSRCAIISQVLRHPPVYSAVYGAAYGEVYGLQIAETESNSAVIISHILSPHGWQHTTQPPPGPAQWPRSHTIQCVADPFFADSLAAHAIVVYLTLLCLIGTPEFTIVIIQEFLEYNGAPAFHSTLYILFIMR